MARRGLMALLAVCALAVAPAHRADATPERQETAAPAAAQEQPPAYITVQSAGESAPPECLWRMPPLRGQALQIYSALSLRRAGDAGDFATILQVTGAQIEGAVLQSASFATAQLKAGPVDTAAHNPQATPGTTVRVALPGALTDALVDAMPAGAELSFTLADGMTYVFAIPAPTAADIADFKSCLSRIRPPAP